MTRVNGIYRVESSKWGYTMIARDLRGLFPEEGAQATANVLFYMDRDSLETEKYGRHLAYAMSLDRFFRVGVTVHPDVDISEIADVVLTRFRLSKNPEDYSEFYKELEESQNDKIIFTEEKQARDFSGKTIDEIVRLIRFQTLARTGN